MKARSAKAKGQRAAKDVQTIIMEFFNLNEDDIRVTPSGMNGPDILLSSEAKKLLPFAIEVKNQEKLNIWAAVAQAEQHVKNEEIPVVVFKRNRSKTYVTLELMDFLEVINRGRDEKSY